MPGYEYKWIRELEPDTKKALWWYELSGRSHSINECKNYIEAEENGFYFSDTYGKVGINPANKKLVKIDIENFNGGGLKADKSYTIRLIGADTTQGRLEAEGATLVDTLDELIIEDISGDSVVLRFIYAPEGDSSIGTTISERVLPVEEANRHN